MSDERFFAQVKSSVHDYQPAVPESVYSGMRKKLWWSNFTRLSFSRFNMYYLLVLIGGASAFFFLRQDSNNMTCVAPAPAVMQPATSATLNHAPAAEFPSASSSTAVNEAPQPSAAVGNTPASKANARHTNQHVHTAASSGNAIATATTPAVVEPITNPATVKSDELSASNATQNAAANQVESATQPVQPVLKSKPMRVPFLQDKKNAPKN